MSEPATDIIRADQVLAAYCRGVFPMADARDGGEIHWYRPEMRGVIPLDGFRMARSVRAIIRRGTFEVRANDDFRGTIEACAERRNGELAEEEGEDESWISEEIVDLYVQLHEAGFGHSVEAYLDGALVGGLYGLGIHGAFFGESMFCRPELGGSNASKVCLAYLVGHLKARGFALLDTQFITPHLARFGCIEISRQEYEMQLGEALSKSEVKWGDFPAHDPCNLVERW